MPDGGGHTVGATDIATDPAENAPDLEIIRDPHGIPHVRAASAEGALFGHGLVTGTDRAWQIEFLRLRGEGRTAEVFGLAGVGWDAFARRAQIDRAARRIHDASSERTRRLLRAYADGVNHSHTDASAIELTEFNHRPSAWNAWTPITIFIVQHLMFGRFATKLWRLHACQVLGPVGLDFVNSESANDSDDRTPAQPSDEWITELLQQFSGEVPIPPGTAATPPPLGDAISGSNAWGVAGANTATGSPLIAGDPHRFIEVPGVYQQVHLAAPEFDVVGLAFSGVPGVPHFAQTPTVAWGITNAMADYQDLYVEKLGTSAAGVVARSADGESPVTSWTEQIVVRDADTVEVEIIETVNGSVLFGGPDTAWAVSLRTPFLSEPDSTFDAVIDLLFAQDVPAVERALADWVEPVNRVVAADTDGRLVNRLAGRVPIRADENYWLPVPGWDERYRWREVVSVALYDRDFDAAVTDHSVIANQRITDCAPLQPVTTECAPSSRASRIDHLLSTSSEHSVADSEEIHRDVANEQTQVMRDLLVALPRLEVPARDLRDRLLAWDGAMHADSVEAYLFAELRNRLVARIAGDEVLAGLATPPNGFPRWLAPYFVATTRIGAGIESVIRNADAVGLDIQQAAIASIQSLAAEIDGGAATPTWGEVHVLAPFHGIDFAGVTPDHPELSAQVRPDALPLAGDAECVFANASAVGYSHVCRLGSVARYVWDVADRDKSRWIVPLGASGDPGSPHFQDQASSWSQGELIDVVGDWPTLRRTAERRETHGRLWESDAARTDEHAVTAGGPS
ncbi:penicillin acylase family protein [Gordonia soli]|uniref:Putative penicillin amidase n=1 Tax=Gordonia soli NBRC 108243 TaxID=1223545 RepID=M0QQH2_9ACTN|nr:penicillin acylase family protein [Gordonia soli]GAC70649.1 putative penicillin amidase [Gordonia soli NBRC 108243]